MDNLTFSTSRQGETKEGDADVASLKVSTMNRKNVMYSTIMTDFIRCQLPKPMLTAKACEEFIVDGIKDVTYIYNNETDIILVSLEVFPGKLTIKFSLTNTNESVPLEVIVSQLAAKIDEMEPYEIIHTFTYPKWDTFEEFSKLPGFKYFEAVYNLYKYTKDLVYRQRGVGIDSISRHLFDGDLYYTIGDGWKALPYSYGMFMEDHIKCCTVYMFDNATCKGSGDGENTERNQEFSSCAASIREKEVHYSKIQYCMSKTPFHRFGLYDTSEYIKDYTVGWVLENFPLVASRDPIIECVCDSRDMSVTVHIKRLKKKCYHGALWYNDKHRPGRCMEMPKIGFAKLTIDGATFS